MTRILIVLAALFSVSVVAQAANWGWWENQDAFTETLNAEKYIGRKFAVVHMYANLCYSQWGPWWINQSIGSGVISMTGVWDYGSVPAVSLGTDGCPGYSDGQMLSIISSGQFDSTINQSAIALATWLKGNDKKWGTADDRRVYISLNWEMNGNWYPWSLNGTALYISAWRRVNKLFNARIPSSVRVNVSQWVFTVNGQDTYGIAPMEQWYPGNAYVDWLGIDSYNFAGAANWGVSPWQTPTQTFDGMVQRLKKLAAKPIAVMETGTSSWLTSTSQSYSSKDAWIASAFAYFKTAAIKMVLWFNEHDPPCDWDVFSPNTGGAITTVEGGTTYYAYSAWATAMKDTYFVGGSLTTPGRITNKAFRGL